MEIDYKKKLIRNQYITIRNNILEKERKSKLIINKIKDIEEYQKAKIIALYKSLPSEVNTDELIEYSIKIGKIIALPKVIDNVLKFYKIDLDEKLIKSSFGVYEPKGDSSKYIDLQNIDLVIVPGICFDKEKNRLGFGKGYYDRFLENSNLNTIGICFSEQILINDSLPTNNNDIKVKKIITNKEIF